jgi:hypothetical protein
LPEKNLVTPHQAQMEAINWLERLDRGEISNVSRANLNVYLTPVQIQQRIATVQGFEIYSSDEIGQFTFIEARKL